MPEPAFDILALDVDGTLLNTRGSLSKRNAEAVRAALDAGVMVVLATARPPRTTRPLIERLGLDQPVRCAGGAPRPALMINYNGAAIWRIESWSAASHRPLDKAIAQSVIACARSVDAEVFVTLDHLDRWYTDRDDPARRRRQDAGATPDFIGPHSSFKHIAPSKLLLHAAVSNLSKIRSLVMDEYVASGLASCRVTFDDRLEVQAPGVDKGEALLRIARSLRVPRQRICAVGDAPNDEGMLEAAGLGLAVRNAWGAARTAADRILDADSDSDPVAEAVERYVFLRS